jgi:Phage regulatory protein CII (CP76)
MQQASERGRDFADLVYTVLVAEKKWPLKDVAERMGMQYATLHARLHRRVVFSPEEVRDLIVAAPDIRLIAYFLDNSPFIAVDRRDLPEGSSIETLHFGATRSVLEVADVLRAVEKGMDDARIDHRDRAKINKEIAEAERALAALRQRLETEEG